MAGDGMTPRAAIAAAAAAAGLALLGYGGLRVQLAPEHLWAWLAALSMCF
jgi:hypothetical protein